MPTPQAALIEIVERTDSLDPLVIVPNEIRINGIPLLAPSDTPIKVHEIEINGGEVVMVTLTLYARRVIIGAEAEKPSAFACAVPGCTDRVNHRHTSAQTEGL